MRMEINSKALSTKEVRRLVNAYFALTSHRELLAVQAAAAGTEIEHALDAWTDTVPAGRWAKSVTGITPAMAAGLAAHIHIEAAPTAGSIWRFAGLDPSVICTRGGRRPWNPSLKHICLRIGRAFAASAGQDGDFYGKLYRQRAAMEAVANKNRSRQDRLRPAHIEARARRWTVKLFLAHYHHVAWKLATGSSPVKPYVIDVLGRREYIAPPNFNGGIR
jgi:hypothetical protein